jgi:hypothetical protein
MNVTSSTRADITRIFGPIDDHKVLQIMDLDPALEELEIALAYLENMTDVMAEERQPLAGKAAEIYEIVIRDEFFEEEEPGPR